MANIKITRGKIDPTSFYQDAVRQVTSSRLNGFVPRDGAKYGITKGTPQEWARLFTKLAQQESGLRQATVNPDGTLKKFKTTPENDSFGPLQFNKGQYGLRTWQDVNDPSKSIGAAIKVAERFVLTTGTIASRGKGKDYPAGWGGMAAYFGPFRTGIILSKDANAWFNQNVNTDASVMPPGQQTDQPSDQQTDQPSDQQTDQPSSTQQPADQKSSEVERIPEEERKKLQPILDKNPDITIDQANAAADAGAAYGVSRERMIELLVKGDPEVEKLIPSAVTSSPASMTAQDQSKQTGFSDKTALIINAQGYAHPSTGKMMHEGHGRTSEFGYGRGRLHAGVDIYSTDPETGKLRVGDSAPVNAPKSGTITAILKNRGRAGNMIIMKDDKGIEHRFLHVGGPAINPETKKPWKSGEKINQGQLLTTITGSGTEFGKKVNELKGDVNAAVKYFDARGWGSVNKPHLHYETRVNGKPVNPSFIFPDMKANTGSDSRKSQMLFSNQQDKLKHQLSTGQITKIEYDKKIQELVADLPLSPTSSSASASTTAPATPAAPAAAPRTNKKTASLNSYDVRDVRAMTQAADTQAQNDAQNKAISSVLNTHAMDASQDGPATTPTPAAPTLPTPAAPTLPTPAAPASAASPPAPASAASPPAPAPVPIAGGAADMIPPPGPSSIAGPGGEMAGGPESTSVSSEDLTRTREAAATKRGREILGQGQATQPSVSTSTGESGGQGPSSTPSQNNTDYSPPSPGSTGQSHSDESLCWV